MPCCRGGYVGLLALFLMFVAVAFARADDTQKEVAKARFTEFCRVVKRPPMWLIQQAQEQAQAGNTQAQELMMWITPIAEAWQKNGCGDA